VFLLFNIALGAYILGTITLLVVKNDERTGRYRDLSSNLKTYRWVCVDRQGKAMEATDQHRDQGGGKRRAGTGKLSRTLAPYVDFNLQGGTLCVLSASSVPHS
jgi:hypothetical protein